MEFINVLAAVLQGLLEWWPVSSSSVVMLFLTAIGYPISEGYSYALALHLGSGLAVILVFKKVFINLLKNLIKGINRDFTLNYIFALFVSFVTAYPLYLFFYNSSPLIGWAALLVVAFGLLITSMLPKRSYGLENNIGWRDWALTGFLQGVAVLPGFSRKGLTIGYLVLRKYRPDICVTTSFMLGAPALIVAGLYNSIKLLEARVIGFTELVLLQIIVFLSSSISAKTFLSFSQKTDFRWFTIVLSILTLLTVIIQLVVGE